MAKYVTVGLLLIAIFSYDIMLLSHYYIYYNMFSPGVPRPRALLILCHYVILYLMQAILFFPALCSLAVIFKYINIFIFEINLKSNHFTWLLRVCCPFLVLLR